MSMATDTRIVADHRSQVHADMSRRHMCAFLVRPSDLCEPKQQRNLLYEDLSTQSDNYHDQQLVTDEHVPCRIAPSEVRRCDCSRHDNCHFGLIDPRMQ